MPPINQGSTEYEKQPPQDQLTQDQPQPQTKKRGKIFWDSIIMININRGLAALAIAGVSARAFSGCNAATIAEDVVPIAPEESTGQTYDSPPIEEEVGDEGQTVDDGKLAVAGKETFTYDDGLAISIGNIRKAKVPDMNEHVGAPAVRFDVRVTNNSPYRLDADMSSVSLSYGPDGREGTSIYVEHEDALSGTVAKGRKKTGTYSFEVPTKHQKDMVIEVNPDFEREPALFAAGI